MKINYLRGLLAVFAKLAPKKPPKAAATNSNFPLSLFHLSLR